MENLAGVSEKEHENACSYGNEEKSLYGSLKKPPENYHKRGWNLHPFEIKGIDLIVSVVSTEKISAAAKAEGFFKEAFKVTQWTTKFWGFL